MRLVQYSTARILCTFILANQLQNFNDDAGFGYD